MGCLGKVAEIINLSDDSNSSFEMAPLGERIGLCDTKQESKMHKNISTDLKPIRKAHSISDSAESDDDPENKLPDLADLLSNSPVFPAAKKLKKPALHVEVTLSDADEEFKQSLTNIPKRQTKTTKKVIDKDKEAEKERKLKMREEKKREKELEKALKASEKEMQKSKKPEECLKSMKVVADHNIIFIDEAQDIFNVLDSNEIKYTVEENDVKFSVIWFRTVSNISVENCQLVKEEREEVETVMIVLIPNQDFLYMVHSSVMRGKGKQSNKMTLLEYISNLKGSFPEMTITCVMVGFNKYIRNLKEGNDSELKSVAKQVPKTASEEVIIEVQLQAFVNFNFVESMTEFGNLLCRFTKAVAEAPQRREKQKQKAMAFSWFADADSSCPVKTNKDGSGLIELWRQQIKQFQNVGAEIAEAIASKYPSPQLLLQAYKHCNTIKEKETLLQDIVVRRNYGPLGTQRRIGPELSYKIYLFFSSRDGNQILQR